MIFVFCGGSSLIGDSKGVVGGGAHALWEVARDKHFVSRSPRHASWPISLFLPYHPQLNLARAEAKSIMTYHDPFKSCERRMPGVVCQH
jgi:hypothetical protein